MASDGFWPVKPTRAVPTRLPTFRIDVPRGHTAVTSIRAVPTRLPTFRIDVPRGHTAVTSWRDLSFSARSFKSPLCSKIA